MTETLSMRERIARAIYAQIPNGGTVSIPSTSSWERDRHEYRADPWEEAEDRHEQCFSIADAVLEAMREPSEAMIAGLYDEPLWGFKDSYRGKAELIEDWQAMIDAAIREGKDEDQG